MEGGHAVPAPVAKNAARARARAHAGAHARGGCGIARRAAPGPRHPVSPPRAPRRGRSPRRARSGAPLAAPSAPRACGSRTRSRSGLRRGHKPVTRARGHSRAAPRLRSHPKSRESNRPRREREALDIPCMSSGTRPTPSEPPEHGRRRRVPRSNPPKKMVKRRGPYGLRAQSIPHPQLLLARRRASRAAQGQPLKWRSSQSIAAMFSHKDSASLLSNLTTECFDPPRASRSAFAAC